MTPEQGYLTFYTTASLYSDEQAAWTKQKVHKGQEKLGVGNSTLSWLEHRLQEKMEGGIGYGCN